MLSENEAIHQHQQKLDEMFVRFNLSAKSVCKESGVSETMLSRFRNGKADLGSGKLIALLQAVPQSASVWYISQLLGTTPEGLSIVALVLQATPQEKGEVLSAIGEWVKKPEVSHTDSRDLLQLKIAV